MKKYACLLLNVLLLCGLMSGCHSSGGDASQPTDGITTAPTQPAGPVTRFLVAEECIYFSDGELCSKKSYTYDEKGRITEYSYDDGNHTFYFDYDDEKNQLIVTSRNEEWKHYYQYDQEGRITQGLYCIPLPEGYMEDWNYNSTLRTFVYNDSGKIETYEEKYCYTIDPCDLSQIDQVQDWKNNYETTCYYDDRGNLTGAGKPDQYEYDENNLLILKDVIEMVPIRGEIVERIYAKYTRDEHGNILRFEEYRFSEDATWVAMELTESQAEAAERRLFMNGYGYDIFDVLKNVWVQPYPSPWSYDVFAHLISGAPW